MVILYVPRVLGQRVSSIVRTMKSQLKLPVSIAFVVAMAATSLSSMATGFEFTAHQYPVTIENSVGTGPITAHCSSNTVNLGCHTIPNGHTYNLDFVPDYWGTTVFWCDFFWQQRRALVVVWAGPGNPAKHVPCTYCEWAVEPNGFFCAESGKKLTYVQAWMYPYSGGTGGAPKFIGGVGGDDSVPTDDHHQLPIAPSSTKKL